ncbi:MAG: glycosyltransferase [Rhizobiaceae bacterium]
MNVARTIGTGEPIGGEPADPAIRHAVRSWREIFASRGVDTGPIAIIAAAASRNGNSFHGELAASGHDIQCLFYRLLAAELGIRFCSHVDPDRLVARDRDLLPAIAAPAGPALVMYRTRQADNAVLISPAHLDLDALRGYLERYPAIAARMLIVAPAVLRQALLTRARLLLAERATSRLFERHPQYSARIVANAVQGFGLGLLVTLITTGFYLDPATVIALLHVVFSLCFLACVMLRLIAALGAKPPLIERDIDHAAEELPVYTILVALYRESDMVPGLLVALSRLVWPRSKLEIKLLLEEDDEETLAAVRAQKLRANVEILTVPRLGPRTKPKALSYAMPAVSGEFVTVYDAEDIPHPAQLLEAWRAFSRGDDCLACVQAPLCVRNVQANLLTRLFAFEYAALFRGLLPMLARKRLFFPLGGTSNHFRVSALRRIGAWDPFNVTEDADLSVRLARFGYRLDMITCPTFEDAPDRLGIWMRQRTRWFKGWMQTFLVHSRNPVAVSRQMGAGSYLVSQILLFGIIVSSLAYIFIVAVIASIAYKYSHTGNLTPFDYTLLLVDTANVLLGLSAFLLLGWKTLLTLERKGFWKVVLATPFYWLIMSLTAWRAAWQLYRQPFLWEKTPHRRPAAKPAGRWRAAVEGGIRTPRPEAPPPTR